MAFANATVTDIIATTIQQRSGKLADNLTYNNAALKKLRDKGNVRPFGGGNVILEEIMYNDTTTINANSYSGYEAISVQANSPISAAQFNIAQYAASVTISGLEMLQNSSKEQIIDLMEGRMKVAEGQLINRISGDLYGDGTGNGGRNLTGFGAALTTDGSGTYGGIPRATWSFWSNQYYRGVTDGGSAVSAANIQTYLTTLTLRCVRGNNKPDLVIFDSNYYGFYVASLQAIQRISNDGDSGAAGFASLKFYGGGIAADVVLDGGIGSSNYNSGSGNSNNGYVINTDYMYFRPHRDRNFVPIGGERQAINQDSVTKLIGWAGNLTSSGPQFCGRLSA